MIIIMLALFSHVFGTADDPIKLRLNWKPGEIFKYRMELSSAASAAGESAQIQIAFDIALKVVETYHTKDRGLTKTSSYEENGDSQSFALGGRLTDIALEYGRQEPRDSKQRTTNKAMKHKVFFCP